MHKQSLLPPLSLFSHLTSCLFAFVNFLVLNSVGISHLGIFFFFAECEAFSNHIDVFPDDSASPRICCYISILLFYFYSFFIIHGIQSGHVENVLQSECRCLCHFLLLSQGVGVKVGSSRCLLWLEILYLWFWLKLALI